MVISITAAPHFHFLVTRPVVAVLIKLSANHYDSNCRLLGARVGLDGPVNGVLRIWQDSLDFEEPSANGKVQVHAVFRDLDTVLKCMENNSRLTDEEQRIVDGLRRDFLAALQLANAKHHEWTAEYVSPNSTVSTT